RAPGRFGFLAPTQDADRRTELRDDVASPRGRGRASRWFDDALGRCEPPETSDGSAPRGPHEPRCPRIVRFWRWSSSHRGRGSPARWPRLPVRVHQLPISFESSHRLPSRGESVGNPRPSPATLGAIRRGDAANGPRVRRRDCGGRGRLPRARRADVPPEGCGHTGGLLVCRLSSCRRGDHVRRRDRRRPRPRLAPRRPPDRPTAGDVRARVDLVEDRMRVRSGDLTGQTVDVSNTPDLFPILAVLATQANGETRFVNGDHLRVKESDRIASTVAMLRALGAQAEPTPDGCVVHGPASLPGAFIDARADHRVLMAAAIAGLAADDSVDISDPWCFRVSYPSFLDDMRALGALHAVVE